MIYANNKRYNTLDGYLKNKFGCKVAKVSLNAGFGCPNRDGTCGTGGCIYCSPMASGDFAGNKELSIRKQFDEISAKMGEKWHGAKFMPYFQAGTNTYAPVEKLREVYEQALAIENIVGISIATRPDCIPDDVLLYLEEISRRTFLTVELGLQTVFDKTGEIINRGTTYTGFLECFQRLRERDINVCVHLINGLPGEDRDMMMESVRRVAALSPHSLKLHMLHVLKDTPCADMYMKGEFSVFEKQEYIDLVCDELEIIPSDIVIQRITGDGARESLIAPLWSIKKFDVLNGVDKELARRNSYQGIKA
ncbi:MAG: TIGR01212 family radical SAM protein [Clostridia bacterium]|nr:TIGR01212 family radical SAM protein [Clostridia bacterium]